MPLLKVKFVKVGNRPDPIDCDNDLLHSSVKQRFKWRLYHRQLLKEADEDDPIEEIPPLDQNGSGLQDQH